MFLWARLPGMTGAEAYPLLLPNAHQDIGSDHRLIGPRPSTLSVLRWLMLTREQMFPNMYQYLMSISDSPQQRPISAKGKCPGVVTSATSRHRSVPRVCRCLTAIVTALCISAYCPSIAQHLARADSHPVKSRGLCLFFSFMSSSVRGGIYA